MIQGMVDIAGEIRAAMLECTEEKDGRYYATEAGCEKLRAILAMHGIEGTVAVSADGRFEVRTTQKPSAHTCHWPGCGKAVPPAMWGCKGHWFKLPKVLRDRIWETYRPGQEITKTPSAAYLAVAQEVQQWIASQP